MSALRFALVAVPALFVIMAMLLIAGVLPVSLTAPEAPIGRALDWTCDRLDDLADWIDGRR